MTKKFDTVVCYTDGSHFDKGRLGTGAGLHVVFFNREEIGEGVSFPGCPEVLTETGYKKPGNIKASPVTEGMVERYDGILPLIPHTAQYAELSVLFYFFNNNPLLNKLVDKPKIYLYSDSTYAVSTYNLWMDNWKKKNWTRDGSSPVKNLSVVLNLYKVKQRNIELGLDITIEYIPGHKGHYGNERTDGLAKEASAFSASNSVEVEEISWVQVDDDEFTDKEPDAGKPKKKTKSRASKATNLFVPDVSAAKLHYVLTNEPSPKVTVDDEEYYYHMAGNHVAAGKSDDIMFCGKHIPDAMFTVAFRKEPWTNVKRIADEHHRRVWEDTPIMKRYDSVVCVHATHLKRQIVMKAAPEGILPYDEMEFKEAGNSWMYGKLLISRIQRPPLLSYRILTIRSELVETLKLCFLKHKGRTVEEVTLTDITDLLFDEGHKPRKDYYRQVDKVLTVKAKQPCSDHTVGLRFTRGISLFDRPGVNRIHKPGGKWYVYAIKNGEYTFKYGIAYISDEESVLFTAYYRNLRIIKDIIDGK